PGELRAAPSRRSSDLVVAQGSFEDVLAEPRSLTGQYLSGVRRIEIPKRRHRPNPKMQLHLRGASGNNLKDVDLAIPAGLFTAITDRKSTRLNSSHVKK